MRQWQRPSLELLTDSKTSVKGKRTRSERSCRLGAETLLCCCGCVCFTFQRARVTVCLYSTLISSISEATVQIPVWDSWATRKIRKLYGLG